MCSGTNYKRDCGHDVPTPIVDRKCANCPAGQPHCGNIQTPVFLPDCEDCQKKAGSANLQKQVETALKNQEVKEREEDRKGKGADQNPKLGSQISRQELAGWCDTWEGDLM